LSKLTKAFPIRPTACVAMSLALSQHVDEAGLEMKVDVVAADLAYRPGSFPINGIEAANATLIAKSNTSSNRLANAPTCGKSFQSQHPPNVQ